MALWFIGHWMKIDESTSQFEQQWNIINVDKIINEFVWLICGPVESIEILQISKLNQCLKLHNY